MKASQFVVAATSTTAGAHGYVPVVLSTCRTTTTMAAGGAAGQWARLPRLPIRKRQLGFAAVATADGGVTQQTFSEVRNGRLWLAVPTRAIRHSDLALRMTAPCQQTPDAQLRIGYRPFKLVEHAALLCMSAAVFYARLRKVRQTGNPPRDVAAHRRRAAPPPATPPTAPTFNDPRQPSSTAL